VGKRKNQMLALPNFGNLETPYKISSVFFWLGGSSQPIDADSLYHDTFLDFFYNVELKPLKKLKEFLMNTYWLSLR